MVQNIKDLWRCSTYKCNLGNHESRKCLIGNMDKTMQHPDWTWKGTSYSCGYLTVTDSLWQLQTVTHVAFWEWLSLVTRVGSSCSRAVKRMEQWWTRAMNLVSSMEEELLPVISCEHGRLEVGHSNRRTLLWCIYVLYCVTACSLVVQWWGCPRMTCKVSKDDLQSVQGWPAKCLRMTCKV